jgi:hypothetical protein
MSQTRRAVAAHVVPWKRRKTNGWGVSVDYEDGHRVVYRAASRQNARSDVMKIKADPEFAAKIRLAAGREAIL